MLPFFMSLKLDKPGSGADPVEKGRFFLYTLWSLLQARFKNSQVLTPMDTPCNRI